jgi:hypothetical protein
MPNRKQETEMTYENQIDAKRAAQLGANASGVTVYVQRTRIGRWEVTIERPLEGNYGVFQPQKGE